MVHFSVFLNVYRNRGGKSLYWYHWCTGAQVRTCPPHEGKYKLQGWSWASCCKTQVLPWAFAGLRAFQISAIIIQNKHPNALCQNQPRNIWLIMTSVLMTQTTSLLFKGLLYVHFSRETSSLGAKSSIQLLPFTFTGKWNGQRICCCLIQSAPAGCIPILLSQGILFPITWYPSQLLLQILHRYPSVTTVWPCL